MKLSPPPFGASEALRDIQEAVRELGEPTQPGRVFACLEADLPPADRYQHCHAILSDTRALVISTYSGSAWEWTNADGSAI